MSLPALPFSVATPHNKRKQLRVTYWSRYGAIVRSNDRTVARSIERAVKRSSDRAIERPIKHACSEQCTLLGRIFGMLFDCLSAS